MSIEANKAAARRFIANLPNDVIEEDKLAPDFTYWTIPTGIIPRDVITAPGAKMGRLFDGPMTITETGITAEGDRVAMEAKSDGLLVSGKRYSNIYHFLFVFAPDGRLREVKEHMNTAHFTETLGPVMMPAQ
jgi:ketosteroid isomerase-like protein